MRQKGLSQAGQLADDKAKATGSRKGVVLYPPTGRAAGYALVMGGCLQDQGPSRLCLSPKEAAEASLAPNLCLLIFSLVNFF